MAKDRYVAYVGTYTHGSSVGIHIFDVDAEKGKMVERKVVPINNPSDVIVSTSGKFLNLREGDTGSAECLRCRQWIGSGKNLSD